MGLKLIGIGGNAIVQGHQKDSMSMIWSLMKHRLMSEVKGGNEKELIQWVNARVSGICPPIRDFRDKTLSTGTYLIHVISTIEKKYVKQNLVKEGSTDEEKALNAKYGITLARKLGANVFCLWEDMVKVDPKQNLIMYATLQGIVNFRQMQEEKRQALANEEEDDE